MGSVIKIAGFGPHSTISPFTNPGTGSDIGVDPTAPEIQLYVSKLAPKQDDRWVAAATWGQPDGAPDDAPVIAGGAIAWKDANLQYHHKNWDGTPLPEDPRDTENQEPWGAFRPRWVGHGCLIGDRRFAKEGNVEIGDPTVEADTAIDLAPGMVLVPQAIAGLARYDLSDPRNPSTFPPAAESIPGLRFVSTSFGYSYYAPHDGEVPGQDPLEFGQTLGTGIIVFEQFHPDQTVEQVQANTTRPSAEPLDRPAEIGDQLAVNLTYQIFYQTALGGYTYQDEIDDYYVGARPAGTWEKWFYTIPGSGERTVQSLSAAPSANYGITVTGTEGENVTQTGTIHQLLWHYNQSTLLTGTWSFTRRTEKTGNASKPPGTAGPANGDGSSPGGTGFPDDWPSGADGAIADGGWWHSKTRTKPHYGYWVEEETGVSVSWGFSGGATGWSEVVPFRNLRWVAVPSQTVTVSYDSRQGTGPSYQRVDYLAPFTYDQYAPYPIVPLFNGVSYISVGGSSCNYSSLSEFPSQPGNTGGWSQNPNVSSPCQLWGQWYRGQRVTEQLQIERVDNTGTPESVPPNPDDFPELPGSGVPGGGPPGSDPPGFGFPPSLFPDADWESSIIEITEYDIQAAVGPTLRSPQHFRLTITDSSNHGSDWNGSRSNSSISSTPSSTTYELEHETPYAMLARSPINAANTEPEEALYLVRTLAATTQSTAFTTPYPYDSETVYYLRAGQAPVAISGNIQDLFPAIAWQDPERFRWEQFACLINGVLYVLPGPGQGKDYRGKDVKISPQAYQVSDGTLSPVTAPALGVTKGDDPNATVYDASFAIAG